MPMKGRSHSMASHLVRQFRRAVRVGGVYFLTTCEVGAQENGCFVLAVTEVGGFESAGLLEQGHVIRSCYTLSDG